MLPVTELRGAIPFFLVSNPETPVLFIVLIAIIGNTLPNFFILWIVPRLNTWLLEHSKARTLLHWFTQKIHEKHSQKFYRWGMFAILLIGSIPIPGTGSYTAATLAALFNVPFWKSMAILLIGNCIAATIVTFTALGILSLTDVF